MRSSRTVSVAGTAVVVFLALAAVGVTPAAAAGAATRYAAPNGSGDCTASSPCDIQTAISEAPSDTTVVLEPGQYGSLDHPLTQPLETDLGVTDVTIEGQSGKPAPLVVSVASAGVELEGSELLDVRVDYLGDQSGLSLLNGSTADHVLVTGSGQLACALGDDSTLVNTVCSTTRADSDAVLARANGSPVTATIRNVTAVANGSGGVAVDVVATSGGSASVAFVNSIAVSDAQSVDVFAGSGSSATVTARFSNVTAAAQGGSGDGVAHIDLDESDVTTASAAFVNSSAGDYREAKTSPTIDKGSTSAAQGTTDLAGLPRVIGPSVDMGAYEFPPPPGVGTLRVVHRGNHSITLHLAVSSHGLPGATQVTAVHHGTPITDKAKAFDASAKARHLTLHATGLGRHKKYRIRVTVQTAGGSKTSKALTAKTH